MRRTVRARRQALAPAGLSLAMLLGLAALVVIAAPAAAHKAHRAGAAAKPAAARDSMLSTAVDTMAARGASGAEGGAAAPFVMPSLWEALLEHPHNKIVHFPLALAVAAALLLLLARRRPELEPAGRWLVWFAALGGVAAYVSGRLQERAFEGEPKEWLVQLHEKWGLATGIALVMWALLTLWKPGRRRAWLWGLVAATLACIAGFYGGIVAHGE